MEALRDAARQIFECQYLLIQSKKKALAGYETEKLLSQLQQDVEKLCTEIRANPEFGSSPEGMYKGSTTWKAMYGSIQSKKTDRVDKIITGLVVKLKDSQALISALY